ncbi:type I methionyl aminopeptidase [Thermodesulfobacterium sp. TA1]|uniref:type I methionyl aminopeptidase n=1 Tax=Thermodesulfobacterium sp. TA1 TaxID=2234087 RepID=UPI00351ADD31
MEVLFRLKEEVRPGVSTWEFEELALILCEKRGVKPAFKGYRGYPYALCVSINEEIVHGMPKKDKILKEGDIVSFDFGVIYEGYVGDAALTVGVGKVSEKAERLMRVTEEALYKGIEKAHFGNKIGDISFAIQSHVEKYGFNVIREFVGHGVGRSLHEPPEVPNWGRPGRGPKIEVGMVLAIEPMVSAGDYRVEILLDGWTAVTKDRSLAAHFEHSVAITPNGPEILSKV